MSRLYLVFIVFILQGGFLFGQSKLGSYLKAAEEKFQKGDYYYALELYGKAMELDSNSVAILWNYAETFRAYKDYRKAEYYYKKVYEREESSIYPYSLLYWGLMQKQNGKYDEAVETFKKAKKKYAKDKKGYLYSKSKRELESCLWAKSAIKDTSEVSFYKLPESVNTKDSEFGHNLYDGNFIFSSLRADSVSSSEEVYGTVYKTRLFKSEVNQGRFQSSERMEDLLFENMNTGNGAYSLDGKRFYFSLCSDEGYNYRCKIMVANYENGKWSSPDSLGEIINEEGKNTTMPSIGKLEGQEVLFFSSDRDEGDGGMDIWYSFIKNGNQYSKPRAVKTINSPDNELSPWWDLKAGKLYFSSSWHDGFGGYDIYSTEFTTQFEDPENIGIPFNSPANDLYYFKSGDTSYVTSNRIGVYYSKNPTCCSDIFTAVPPVKIEIPTPKETLADLNRRLPVTLYFHNDVPNPKSWDTITKLNYLTAYNEYHEMIPKYQQEYSAGLTGEKADEAVEDIESFFIEYVDQGVKDLFLFRDLLLEELEKGAKIKVTVRGFASPLAKTDYNVNLTKRRISSFVNYLKEYNGGVFVPYFDGTAKNGGQVVIVGAPFGEYTANKFTSDNFHDQKNSVYSRAAAIERKVEIQSVTYLDNRKIYPLTVDKTVQDAGKIKAGTIIEKEFIIENQSKDTVIIIGSTSPFEFLRTEISKMEMLPGEKIAVKVFFDTSGFAGMNVKFTEIRIEGYEETIKLMISSEIE